MNLITLPLEENNNLYTHIIYEKVFSLEECKKIINSSNLISDSPIHINNEIPEIDKYKRYSKSKSVFCNEENQWIFSRIVELAKDANKTYYNFDISSLRDIQIIKYEIGNYYDWHVDMGKGITSTRKLSMIVLLSDKNEYEGGVLEWNPSAQKFEQNQGTIVFFPSYILHRVTNITKGIRFTLAGWFNGNHFR